MDWLNVLDRIQAGEDEHTELGRYRSFSEKDWQKSACAFANTEGGLIVLGVRDDQVIDGRLRATLFGLLCSARSRKAFHRAAISTIPSRSWRTTLMSAGCVLPFGGSRRIREQPNQYDRLGTARRITD
jgi:hypothetical protein